MSASNPYCVEYVSREEDRLTWQQAERYITRPFVEVKLWHPTPTEMASWLIERLSLHEHVDTVIAGVRKALFEGSLVPAHRLAAAHALHPVRDVPIDTHGAFLDYCHREGIPYSEEDTKLLSDFMKGASSTFADLRPINIESLTEQERIMGGF